MPSKKPTQKLRQHPIPLGRGGKWWHEQVRRNVRAIFDGLVRKGAPADRATMSRAYAFAIGSLVRYGYLKRTTKGLYVTEKGLAKSREKLRTPDAKKKHAAYERQLALVRKPRRRRNPDEPPSRYNEAAVLFPTNEEARRHYTIFLIDPMEAVEPFLAAKTGQIEPALAMAVNEYSTRHRAELGAALRARQTGTPYISPTPSTDRLMGRSTARRSLPSLIPEPEVRTGMRPMTPVSYEEEYGEYGGTMSEAMTEAGIADAAAKAAKRRAARDLLNERRDVMARAGSFRPLMMSAFDPATGETTWTMVIPFQKRRTGADVTISRIRSEVARKAGYPEGDERVTVRKLTIEQIADTDILRDQFRDDAKRLAEATRLYQTIHSRGISLVALPRMRGWTKIGTDKATRAAYYETQAPTAVAWAIANVGPERQSGTAEPLPAPLMQRLTRIGGTAASEKIAQRQRGAVKKREAQALRLAIKGRQMADPTMRARPEEERQKLIELETARQLAARGYVTGRKAEKRIARAEKAVSPFIETEEEEVIIPRRADRMKKAAAPADEPELPRRSKTKAPPSGSIFVDEEPPEEEEVIIPRRADRMKKPQSNPSRRR
jgi:hypothetical protein